VLEWLATWLYDGASTLADGARLTSAVIIPFPTRRSLSSEERALIVQWTAATRPQGIAHVYLSARQESDPPDVHDRILIVETPETGAAWVIHRPARRWILTSGQDLAELGSYGALGDALNAVRAVVSPAIGRGTV
jgi:hypothetical protein